MGIKNEPFQFFLQQVILDLRTIRIQARFLDKSNWCHSRFLDCVSALNHIFTMKSLILAQDER